jgi:hypothetical protein
VGAGSRMIGPFTVGAWFALWKVKCTICLVCWKSVCAAPSSRAADSERSLGYLLC